MKLFKKVELVGSFLNDYEKFVKHCKGLTSVECKAVTYLKKAGDKVSMSDIAEKLGFSTSRATRVIDKLVKKKYVRREYCDDDRRVCWVKLREPVVKELEERKRLRSKVDFGEELTIKDEKNIISALDLLLKEFDRVFTEYEIPRSANDNIFDEEEE